NTHTYAGPTDVCAGGLTLDGAAGGIEASSSLIVRTGAALTLLNTQPPASGSRLGDTVPLTLGGALTLDARTASGAVSARAAIFTRPPNAAATVTMAAGPPAAAEFRFDDNPLATDIVAGPRAAVLFRGTQLGQFASGTPGAANILFADFPASLLVGGG